MKKTLISTSIFLLSSTCYAGLYVGADAGYSVANFAKTLTITNPATSSIDYDKKDMLSGNGAFGELALGYKQNINDKFFLALEFNAGLSALKYSGYYVDTQTPTDEASNAEFRLTKSYGLSVLPGMQISPTITGFARFGYSSAQFKYAEFKSSPSSAPSEGVDEFSWLNGFRTGAGVTFNVATNLDLKVEYNHIFYTSHVNKDYPDMPGRVISIKPGVDQIELGVLYNIA